MYYVDFLIEIHRRLDPATYLEIGVALGKSLSLARCRAVGVDPFYKISYPLEGDFALVRSTSDEYFARPDPLALTAGKPFDLAFIDGLHIMEFALRDFMHAERHAAPSTVVVFDDVLPRSIDEAARDRHTDAWTGDVFWVLEILAKYRPDLAVIPLATQPTGLLLVVGLDPTSTVLADHFDDIMSEFRRPDPQQVPDDILDRLTIVAPTRLLESGVVELLSASRGRSPDQWRPQLAQLISERLGRAWAPQAAVGAS